MTSRKKHPHPLPLPLRKGEGNKGKGLTTLFRKNQQRQIQHYSWADFGNDIPKLVLRIKKLARRKGRFDGIYGIPRGGLPLAVKLSHHLNLPILAGGVTSKTLVVDDVADSGATLLPYVGRKATIVTIFYKPWSKVKPDIWLRKTENHIVFPWEVVR